MYELPKTWDLITLENLVKSERPICYGVVQTGVHIPDGVPCIRVVDVTSGNLDRNKMVRTTKEISQSYKRSILQKGDLMMALRGEIGCSAIVPDNLIGANLTRGIAILSPNNQVISEYFLYALSSTSIRGQIYKCVNGSTFRELPIGELRKLKIAVPPIGEQKKIAEILGTWDEAIRLTEALIGAKERRKRGLMQVLLTGKVRFPEFVRSEERVQTKIGEFPAEWQLVPLMEIGTFAKGKGIAKKELSETGKIPCVRYGEIYTVHHDVIKQFFSYIEHETAGRSFKIENGDLLFAGSGETLEEIGKCVAYVGQDEAYAGGDIIVLRTNKGDTAYMGYLMNHDIVKRQKYKLGQGQSVVHIYSSSLKHLMIPFPTEAEQKRIAAVLSLCDEEIDLLRQKAAALRTQKKGLMQQLLTGNIRVTPSPR